MSGKAFLDTNILIYSFDETAPEKREIAMRLIESALDEHSAIISTQVIQEFINAATRKFKRPLSPLGCRRYLETVLAPLCGVYPTLSQYSEALDIQRETGYSFYDCLILAAALTGGCGILLTEDLQHGRFVRGLIIRNPFDSNQ